MSELLRIINDAMAPKTPAPHVPGPKETALLQVWSVARARVDTLSHWRETLALRRRFSLRFLRVGELKVVVPQGKTPDCDACVEICCTGENAIVSLRLRDIAVLVDAGLESFIERRSAATATTTPTAKKKQKKPALSWARREADGSVFHQVFPVLKRDATTTCRLLTDERMCGAFPHWPLSCARYPYALDLQSKVVFYAKGCASYHAVPVPDAPVKVRELVRAVVDAYNERVKDAIMLYVARKELDELGLLTFLDLEVLP